MRCNRIKPGKGVGQLVAIGLLTLLLPLSVAHAEQDETPRHDQEQCLELVAKVSQENRALHQELRQIKREIALLNQNLENPGVKEIMSGIGYILGLCGVAALVATRRASGKEH